MKKANYFNISNNEIKVYEGQNNMRVELTNAAKYLYIAGNNGKKYPSLKAFVAAGGDSSEYDEIRSAFLAAATSIKHAHETCATANRTGGTNKIALTNATEALKRLANILGARKSDKRTFKNALHIEEASYGVYTPYVVKRTGGYHESEKIAEKLFPVIWYLMAGFSWLDADEQSKTEDEKKAERAKKPTLKEQNETLLLDNTILKSNMTSLEAYVRECLSKGVQCDPMIVAEKAGLKI